MAKKYIVISRTGNGSREHMQGIKETNWGEFEFLSQAERLVWSLKRTGIKAKIRVAGE